MLHSAHRSLCGPQTLVVLPKGGSVENEAEECTDRGCTQWAVMIVAIRREERWIGG